MNKTIENRSLELSRQAFVSTTEAKCIKLLIGESRTFELLDLESLQRLKTRFSRLKDIFGLDLRTSLNGNIINVTRYEDEEIR